MLSFIIPCHNVDHFIQRCLDSIFQCGLDENIFEVLCVDDCSTDGTGAILRNEVERYGNLRLISLESNKGCGGSRNVGIREARGRYLWFVDADDLVKKEGLANAIEMVDKDGLDVLCFNYERVNDNDEVLSRSLMFDKVPPQDGYAFAKKAFDGGIVNHMGYVWRFIYRTNYLRQHQLFFPEKVRWEDTVFMPKALLEAERVAAVSDVLYSYRVNVASISGTFGSVYPASSIYEFAFCAGGDLLKFSEEVKDKELSLSIQNTAVKKYINGFPIYLFRTSRIERKRFYALIKDMKLELKPLKREMKLLERLLLLPVIGPTTAEMGAFIYRFNHKIQ